MANENRKKQSKTYRGEVNIALSCKSTCAFILGVLVPISGCVPVYEDRPPKNVPPWHADYFK